MIFLQILLFGFILANALLGILVFLANRQISVNRQFVLLTSILSLWMLVMFVAFQGKTENEAGFWVRMASTVGAFVPVCSYLMYLGIRHSDDSLKALLLRGKWVVLAGGIISAFSWSSVYLKGAGATIPDTGGLPSPDFGSLYHALSLYYVVMILWLLVGSIVRSRQSNDAAQIMEYQFVAAGLIVLLLLGAPTAVIIPEIRKDAASVPYSFGAIFLMNMVIAYGIAAKQLMHVGAVARSLVSYFLQFVYVAGIYMGLFFLVSRLNIFSKDHLAHIVAAGGIWAVTSGNGGYFTTFLKRIHMFFKPLDADVLIGRARQALEKDSTPSELRRQIQPLIIEAAGTDAVDLRLVDTDSMMDVSAISSYFEKSDHQEEPLILSMAPRLMERPYIEKAASEMQALKYTMAFGIYSNGRYFGLILLGDRVRRGGFSKEQLSMMKTLVRELGVALESAKLYSEIRTSQVYNEILVNSLVSGVVAINNNWDITVMNREARRILDISKTFPLVMEDLPQPVKECLADILEGSESFNQREMIIPLNQEVSLDLLVGGTSITDDERNDIGALLVMHDVTREKTLETKVLASDNWANVGRSTMHEIRNPLSVIGVFLQLIPEFIEDKDYLLRHAEAAEEELGRMDRLLNSLLGYVSSDSSVKQIVRVHRLIEVVTSFMVPKTKDSGITVQTKFLADKSGVYCKPDELKQILMNLIMNGIQAMSDGGDLSITTESAEISSRDGNSEAILIKVVDEGEGMPPSILKKVGKGAFTTKEHGSGIGVQMSSNLVKKMGGELTYKSEVGRGTTAHILIPLRDADATNE